VAVIQSRHCVPATLSITRPHCGLRSACRLSSMRRPGRSRLPRLSTMVEQGGALECLPGDVWIEFLRTSERKVGQGDDANDRVRLITNRKVMYMPVPHCAQGILDAVILSAVDDTPGHNLIHRRGCRIQALSGRAYREILLGQNADESVAFTNGEAADLAVPHLRAASARVVLGVVHSTRRLINSATIMA
jgi:hypothetical protein